MPRTSPSPAARSFREGTRGYATPDDESGQAMAAVAAGLPDAVIDMLAPFVEGLDAAHLQTADRARCQGGAGSLRHLRDLPRPQTAWATPPYRRPRWPNKHPDYLARQLRHYRDGVRGGPTGAALGQSMAAQVSGLSDDRIDRLVAHHRLASPRASAPRTIPR